MSEIEDFKAQLIDYFLFDKSPITVKRDHIAAQLKKLEYPLLAKTLFDIFIRPLKHYSHSSDVQNRLPELYALAMYFYTENDFDYVAILMGMEGIGKSTLGMVIGLYLRELGRNFDPENSIIYTRHEHEDVVDIVRGRTNSVIMFDEGRKFFDLRASMDVNRLSILEAFTTERWRRNIYLICISDISEIDKYFRERRARTVFVIPDRQIFFALQNKSIFGMGDDRFGLERLNWQISNAHTVSYETNMSLLLRLPTCHGFGHFKKFDYESDFWKKYFTEKQKTPNPYESRANRRGGREGQKAKIKRLTSEYELE